MKSPLLTIMCGLPRSGKSTWVEKNKKDSDIVVSPDYIRSDIFGHQFFKPAEPFIWGLTESFVRLLMSQEKDIIIDATHLVPSLRNKWKVLAEEFSYQTRLVYIKSSYEEILKNNRKSGNKKLSISELKRLYSILIEPNEMDRETFDVVLIKRNT